jgi:Zn-dependent M28 family amino/carboxypeptidase
MRFSEEAERFMRPDADRLVCLAGILASRGLPYSVLKTGEARHLALRLGEGKPRLALVAHYDRAPGTPGALDNSCACLQLVEFAARLAARPKAPSSLLFAFTDAEELLGSGEASTQGSYALSLALAQSLTKGFGPLPAGPAGLAALVLDVTGRGGRLLISTAPAALLERNGLSASPAASGYRALALLARRAAAEAGLASPLEAELPWSDDLGLTLGGIPSLALSLLPEDEAQGLFRGERPRTWGLLHTADDKPELAEESSFALMASFLDRIASAL